MRYFLVKLYLANTFIRALKKLETWEKTATEAAIKKMMQKNYTNSLNEEKIHNDFYSARVNLDLRIIYKEYEYVRALVYINHHDEAYTWAQNHFLDINQCQALYIADISFTLDNIEEVKDDNSLFNKLGISLDTIRLIAGNELYAKKIYSLNSYNEVLEFLNRHYIIDEIKEALLALLDGEDQVEVIKSFSTSIPHSIHKALKTKETERRFYLLEDETLLSNLFGDDFEEWQIFLHPSQKYLVTKDFSGPALIEGGPGTGKTVVGLHRAVYLAKYIYPNSEDRILLCTYSKKLAQFLQDKLIHLAKLNHLDPTRIEVDYVENIINKICKENNISINGLDNQAHLEELKKRYNDSPFKLPFKPPFYIKEYEEIIQANHIKTLDEYLAINRRGMKIALLPQQRKEVWQWMEYFIEVKTRKGLLNQEDITKRLEEALDNNKINPRYASIIVDESQDLSPTTIRVLNKLLKTSRNNLFLLSDEDQRIFKMQSFRHNMDINIVGRTYKLFLSYRTSKAIYDFASKALINKNRIKRRYECLYLGLEPIIHRCSSNEEQYQTVANIVRQLLTVNYYEPYQIGIITVIKDKLKILQQVFRQYNINTTLLEQKLYPNKNCGVCLSSVQGIKGLEFRALIYLDYDYCIYNALPIDGLNERLQYTGCTRAREQLFIVDLNASKEVYSLYKNKDKK